MSMPGGNVQTKQQIRVQARRLRLRMSGKNQRSEKIAAALRGLPEYIAAETILFYVGAGSEVPTRRLIEEALQKGRTVVVPYCAGERLGLFRLEDMAELGPGAFGIEEPPPKLRVLPQKSVDPAQIDLAIVPGVAFDPQGGRIGQGKGYYDRFLQSIQSHAKFISPAYDCQIFPSIPTTPHDIPVDIIVTENKIYRPDTSI